LVHPRELNKSTMADIEAKTAGLGKDGHATGKKVRTLGTVRLRHHETNEVILIPTPSDDPNDPLNW
jgi:hypothetical protein